MESGGCRVRNAEEGGALQQAHQHHDAHPCCAYGLNCTSIGRSPLLAHCSPQEIFPGWQCRGAAEGAHLVLLKVIGQDVVLAQGDAARDRLLAAHHQPQQRALPAPVWACRQHDNHSKCGCIVKSASPTGVWPCGRYHMQIIAARTSVAWRFGRSHAAIIIH